MPRTATVKKNPSRKGVSKRLFVTGLGGFVGHWLIREMIDQGWTVGGIVHPSEKRLQKRLEAETTPVDLLDTKKLSRAIHAFRPSHVIHLAGLSSVGQSAMMAREVYRSNIEGTISLLESLQDIEIEKFLFVSSADAYGLTAKTNPSLKESDPLRPASPYGISKAAAEAAALFHGRQFGTPVVVVRAFNHTGPGQRPDFAIPSFASQLAEIENGTKGPVIRVGDLSAKRDLSDVRDIVRGYRLLLSKGFAGEVYNLGSGKSVSMSSLLKQMIGMATIRPIVQPDPARLRKAEIPNLRANMRKMTQATGYKSRYSLATTLRDTLDYWRALSGSGKMTSRNKNR